MKTLLISGLLAAGFMTTGFSQRITDDFDWGAGVAGRESVSSGTSINGIQTQSGGKTWDLASGTAQFSGSAGTGNGSLTLTGGNAVMRLDHTPTGRLIASAQGNTVFPASGVRGFWIGFQSASPDTALLNNQTTDKLYVRLSPGGTLTLSATVGGVTSTGAGSNVAFNDGDTVKLDLAVDMDTKTATLTAENITQSSTGTKTVSWTGTPAWAAFAVNQTGGSTLVLDSVSVGSQATLTLSVLTSL